VPLPRAAGQPRARDPTGRQPAGGAGHRPCIEEHFQVYCERNGHRIREYSETSGVHRLLIERGEGPPKRPR